MPSKASIRFPRSFFMHKSGKIILYFIGIFLLFLLYATTGILGLKINAVNNFATLIWLPSGISLAAMILTGYKIAPAVFAGALVVNVMTGASIPIAFNIAIGNTLEALSAVYLLEKSGFQFDLSRLRDVLLLVLLAAPFGAFLAACIGTSSLVLGKVIPISAFYSTWQAWFIGDFISMIVISPFILTWTTKRPFSLPTIQRSLEIFCLILFTSLLGFTIFQNHFTASIKAPIIYLVFLPILWAALRFGQRAAITITCIISVFAIVATIQGIGPYAIGETSDNLLMLQLFMAVTTVTAIILAAVNMERKAYEERKDEFIGLAAHELKTPITTVKVFTQMLEKISNKKSKNSLYLKKINREIDKLTRLITDLLDISRIQGGALKFSYEYFPLIPKMTDVIDSIEKTTNREITFSYNTSQTQRHIYADKERFDQVLTNLLTNAIKYSPKGKIIASVTFLPAEVIISVKDFGIGIATKHHKKIFSRYFRSPDNVNQTYPGLGIGLYISSVIVKAHRGKLWFRSKKGKGSVFFVSFPLQG